MKYFRITIIALMAMLCLSAGTKAQETTEGQIAFAYAEGKAYIGTSKAETYNVAIHIADANLVGTRILGLRIPMRSGADVSEISGWLTSELKVQSKKNVVDGQEKSAQLSDLKNGFIDLTFDTPYTLTADGIYAGYTFTVNTKENEASLSPLTVGAQTTEDAFWLFTSKTYMKWKAYGEKMECSSALQVILQGENIHTNAVQVVSVSPINVKVGEASTTTVTVANHGSAGIRTLNMKYEVNGQQLERTMTLSPTVKALYGAQATLKLNVPSLPQQDTYEIRVTAAEVNGQDNSDPGATGIGYAYAYNLLPTHRAVLEEYTGTWCGWCPRGFVGMEEMGRLFPDDFIGIAYHNQDPMAFTTDYPSPITGFPSAWLDRVRQTDAYYGDASSGFGIDKAWQKQCETLAPADIEVQAAWTDEAQTQIHAVATVTFPLDVFDCPYQIGYVLLADGLTGDGSSWSQANYYSGGSGWGAPMEMFVKADAHVDGLTFNDVIVDRSGKAGIEGSLPNAVTGGQPVAHSFDFNVSRNAIIQDKNQLRVVALLIDAATGAIVNANKTKTIQADASAVTAPHSEAPIERIDYFDLTGRRITLPHQGILLQQTRRADGSVVTTKRARGK